MGAEWITRTARGRAIIRRLGAGRARDIVADIESHISRGARVLDIGAGGCQVAALLRARGVDVTAVDIHDVSCEPTIVPIIVDGETLPFGDDTFDVALLITMLHHTSAPDRVLAEASRVAKRLVIQEDVHMSVAQKYATMAMDSVINLEFFGHPHTNRSDVEWRAAFSRLGLRVVAATQRPFWKLFRSATYALDRERPELSEN